MPNAKFSGADIDIGITKWPDEVYFQLRTRGRVGILVHGVLGMTESQTLALKVTL